MSGQFVALVRHGHYRQLPAAPSAFQPFPLTKSGHQDAQHSAEKLQHFSQQQGIPIGQTIHCSALLRAWQTAEVIRQQLQGGYALIESILLGERCVGSVANLTTDTIEQVMMDDPRYTTPPEGWKSDSHFRLPFPGAESLMEAGVRVADYLCRIVQPLMGAPSELHVVVGHGAAFRHAACQLGVLLFGRIGDISMYYDQPVFLRLDENKKWHIAGGQWKPRQSADRHMDNR